MPDTVSLSDGQTDKLCPYQTITVSTGIATGMKCIKSACQLWVKTPGDTILSDDLFSQLNGTSDPTGYTTSEDQGRCGAQVSDHSENLFKIAHHFHRHHQHPEGHSSCSSAPLGCGDTFFGYGIPTSLKLAMEFESNEDQDGNGKIYGKDFELIDNEDCPNVLRNLINPTLPKPKNKVTWTNFITNKFPPYYNGLRPNRVSTEGGMLVRLTGAFFVGDGSPLELTLIWDTVPELGGPTTQLEITDITIINSNKLYFRIPEYGVPDGTKIGLKIKNYGNTFDQSGFAAILNTGGTTTIDNALTFTTESDDPIEKQKMEDELANEL